MTLLTSSFRLATAALLLAGASLFGAETPAAKAAKEKAAASASSRAEIQKKIGEQREAMIAEHEVLAKQLKDATDAQKKEILAKMQEQKKKFEELTNALHKQFRDELREQRQKAGPGKK